MKILKLGHKGPAVEYLTQQLNQALYITQVTNVFDEVVRNKVLKFQTHKGLVADGIVGPATWRALKNNQQPLRHQEEFKNIELAYKNKTFRYQDTNHPTFVEKQVLRSFQNYGKAIDQICDALLIDNATAHAVVALESAGSGMYLNKMVIRFENHIFWRKWGKYNPTEFKRWWSFDQEEPWKNHTFNGKALHTGSQDREWIAFETAKTFNKHAACESISMGLGQLMGFHWNTLQYSSPQKMVENHFKGEATQLLDFFEFIAQDFEMLTALQEKDWWTFTYKYNGSGQVNSYSAWLKARYQMAKRII